MMAIAAGTTDITLLPISDHHCPMGTPSSCCLSKVPIVAVPAVSGSHGESAVYRCTGCGHGITMPSISDVSVLYQDRDSQDYQQTDSSLAERIKRYFFSAQARAMFHRLDYTPASLIDFACGSGLLTRCMAAALPSSTRVTALDFFETPPRNLGFVDYLPFARMNKLRGTADTLTCFHVLEHDNDPDDLIRRLLDLLKPNGTLIIEVPNIDCRWGSIFGRYWDNWYLPFHRTHFSRSSLRRLLERHGFAIVEEQPICTPSMGRTLANITRRRAGLSLLLAGAALHPVQWIGERLSQEPSSWRFTARRL